MSSSSSSFGNKRASFGMHFMSNNKKQQLYDLFNTFDKDKDGKVSVAEMKELLDQTGVNTDAVAHMVSCWLFVVRVPRRHVFTQTTHVT